MKLIKWLKRYQTVLTFQFIASVLLFYRAHKMNMLPFKYEVILGVILILLWLIMLKLSKPKKRKYRHEKRKKARPAFGKFLSILLSIAMIFASNMLAKTNGAIAKITNVSYETTVISLITLKDKGLDHPKDVNNKTIGINTEVNKSKVSEAESKLSDKIDFKIKKYNDFANLADALYDHKVSAILIDQSYDTMFLEKHLNFANETQTIWTYKIKVPVSNTRSDIDVTKEPFTILISGVDSRGDVSEKSRSDVDMLVTINPKTHNMLMTSLPRDTFVKISGINGRDKLTHAGLFGTKAVKNTIENFMNIKIDFTARVGFQSVIKIVDALDGIDVYSDKAFTSYADSTIHFVKGTMHMDGRQALAFARELLKGYDHLKMGHHAISFIDKIVDNSASLNKKQFEKLSGHFKQVNAVGGEDNVDEKTEMIIQNAIDNRNKLDIEYYSFSSDESTKRIIHPYGLVMLDSYLGVEAYCELRKEVRRFRVSRIRKIKVLDDHYDEDIPQENRKAFISMSGDDAEEIELLFLGESIRYVKEYEAKKAMRLEERADGLHFYQKSAVTPDVLRWIRGFGPEIKVISPEWLKKQLRDEAKKVLE